MHNRIGSACFGCNQMQNATCSAVYVKQQGRVMAKLCLFLNTELGRGCCELRRFVQGTWIYARVSKFCTNTQNHRNTCSQVHSFVK